MTENSTESEFVLSVCVCHGGHIIITRSELWASANIVFFLRMINRVHSDVSLRRLNLVPAGVLINRFKGYLSEGELRTTIS